MDNLGIQVFTTLYHLRITISGLLHFSIKLDQLIGIQSWIVSNSSFRIEYYTKTGKITCEYDDELKWTTILKGLELIDII